MPGDIADLSVHAGIQFERSLRIFLLLSAQVQAAAFPNNAAVEGLTD